MSLLLWLPLQGDLENIGISNVVVDGHSSTVDTTHGKLTAACQKFTRADTPTNYLSLPALLNADSQFTYTCWFNTASVAQNQCLFSQRTAAEDTGFTIFFMGQTTGTNADTIRFDDGDGLYSTGKISTANQWYHIACVRTTTQKLIYINGELSGTGSTNTPTKVNTNYMTIGGSQGDNTYQPTGNGLNGYLQDIRIYDNALSAAEIKKIAQGLMVHYKLDDEDMNTNLLLDVPKDTAPTAYLGKQLNMSQNLQVDQTYTLQLWDVNVYHSAKTAETTGLGIYWGGGTIQLSLLLGSSYFTQTSTTNYHADHLTTTFTITSTMAGKSGATNSWLNIYNSPGTATGTRNMTIGRWKLEKGAIPTDWISSDANVYMLDSSGYENHAIKNGDIRCISSNNGRYGKVAAVYDNASNLAITKQIRTSENKFSFNIWYNPSEYIDSAMALYIRLNDSLMFNFGYTGAGDSLSHQFLVFRADNYIGCKNWSFPLNEWHMWTGTYDGTTAKLYKDGILINTSGSTTNYNVGTTQRYYILGNNTPTSLKAYASDIRLYATVLDAETIKEMYTSSLKLDNYGNTLAYEFVEDNNNNKLLKNGQLQISNIIEYNNMSFLKYDSNIYFEPDGSAWVHIFHHNNPANSKFSLTNDFENSVYIDADRWFNVEMCNYVNGWELMIIQQVQNGTVQKYRWTQIANPMTATYANVAAAKVTFNSSTEYTTCSHGGLYKKNNDVYISQNTGSTSSWFGGIGVWRENWNGGIPGFYNGVNDNNTRVITTGYIDLYLRIDNIEWNYPTNTRTTQFGTWSTHEAIEC